MHYFRSNERNEQKRSNSDARRRLPWTQRKELIYRSGSIWISTIWCSIKDRILWAANIAICRIDPTANSEKVSWFWFLSSYGNSFFPFQVTKKSTFQRWLRNHLDRRKNYWRSVTCRSTFNRRSMASARWIAFNRNWPKRRWKQMKTCWSALQRWVLFLLTMLFYSNCIFRALAKRTSRFCAFYGKSANTWIRMVRLTPTSSRLFTLLQCVRWCKKWLEILAR